MLSRLSAGYGSWNGDARYTDLTVAGAESQHHRHGVTVNPRMSPPHAYCYGPDDGTEHFSKTFLTRKGALILFSSKAGIMRLNDRLPEEDHPGTKMKGVGSTRHLHRSSASHFNDFKKDSTQGQNTMEQSDDGYISIAKSLDYSDIGGRLTGARPGSDLGTYIAEVKALASKRRHLGYRGDRYGSPINGDLSGRTEWTDSGRMSVDRLTAGVKSACYLGRRTPLSAEPLHHTLITPASAVAVALGKASWVNYTFTGQSDDEGVAAHEDVRLSPKTSTITAPVHLSAPATRRSPIKSMLASHVAAKAAVLSVGLNDSKTRFGSKSATAGRKNHRKQPRSHSVAAVSSAGNPLRGDDVFGQEYELDSALLIEEEIVLPADNDSHEHASTFFHGGSENNELPIVWAGGQPSAGSFKEASAHNSASAALVSPSARGARSTLTERLDAGHTPRRNLDSREASSEALTLAASATTQVHRPATKEVHDNASHSVNDSATSAAVVLQQPAEQLHAFAASTSAEDFPGQRLSLLSDSLSSAPTNAHVKSSVRGTSKPPMDDASSSASGKHSSMHRLSLTANSEKSRRASVANDLPTSHLTSIDAVKVFSDDVMRKKSPENGQAKLLASQLTASKSAKLPDGLSHQLQPLIAHQKSIPSEKSRTGSNSDSIVGSSSASQHNVENDSESEPTSEHNIALSTGRTLTPGSEVEQVHMPSELHLASMSGGDALPAGNIPRRSSISLTHLPNALRPQSETHAKADTGDSQLLHHSDNAAASAIRHTTGLPASTSGADGTKQSASALIEHRLMGDDRDPKKTTKKKEPRRKRVAIEVIQQPDEIDFSLIPASSTNEYTTPEYVTELLSSPMIQLTESITLEELAAAEDALEMKLQAAKSQLSEVAVDEVPEPAQNGKKEAKAQQALRATKSAIDQSRMESAVALRSSLRQKARLEKQQRAAEHEKLKTLAAEHKTRQVAALRLASEDLALLVAKEAEARLAVTALQQQEEESRNALARARATSREEREAHRHLETELERDSARRRRAEQRRQETATRWKQLAALEKIADTEAMTRLWDDERRRQLEEEWLEEEEQAEEDKKYLLAAEEEEAHIAEIEKQAEEEALEDTVAELQAADESLVRITQQLRRLTDKLDQERKQMEAEEQRLSEKVLARQEEERLREEEERQRARALMRLEQETRERILQEVQLRREKVMAIRNKNLDSKGHLATIRRNQGLNKAWMFSYYVHWPRETYERLIGDGKNGKPRRKTKSQA